ncbi:EF-hand domain-containing protein [Pontiella agarivorans]|uniref:EF-hand domain-containing protein n=1 Tax=Pontiella agarivorans TaxID=3038953 RepID=A0ABU5MW53_9BACT|nr:EF-hand domain-containing protein [Pontiella agarivorans]MDZ8118321.1 EF-hand domain-containing protein [Pontiella agarivorans]
MKTQLIIAAVFAAGAALAQQQGGQERREPPTAEQLIARLDKDNDGKISKTEFDGPSEHFTQFDANGDGYLSSNELPSGPPSTGRSGQQGMQNPAGAQQGTVSGSRSEADFVTRLDKDGDGKVSSSEFDGPSEHFTQLDQNGDGYISSSEAPSGPPQGQRGGRR